MVEINNQRKAFLDMLAWSRELITDVRHQNHGYDVIVGGELFTDYPDHPRKLVTLNLKLNQPDATSFFPVGGMPTGQAACLKDFSPKVRTLWHCSRLRSVASPWLIVVISVRQSTVAAISGLHHAGYVSLEHGWQPDCKIQRSGRNGQRDWWRCESPLFSAQ